MRVNRRGARAANHTAAARNSTPNAIRPGAGRKNCGSTRAIMMPSGQAARSRRASRIPPTATSSSPAANIANGTGWYRKAGSAPAARPKVSAP